MKEIRRNVEPQKGRKNTEQKPNKLIVELREILADTFVLYMKTFAVHWNYQGANFYSVHKLTESQYEEMAEAIDEIAERIRAKGERTPVSLRNILAASELDEMKAMDAVSDAAIEDLVRGHKLLAKRANAVAADFDEAGDAFTTDMMASASSSLRSSSILFIIWNILPLT